MKDLCLLIAYGLALISWTRCDKMRNLRCGSVKQYFKKRMSTLQWRDNWLNAWTSTHVHWLENTPEACKDYGSKRLVTVWYFRIVVNLLAGEPLYNFKYMLTCFLFQCRTFQSLHRSWTFKKRQSNRSFLATSTFLQNNNYNESQTFMDNFTVVVHCDQQLINVPQLAS